MPADLSVRAALELVTGRCNADGVALGPRRELTRQRIVAAASANLLEGGYRDMRVDDVAAAAGVSRPTLYTYFESKEHLLIAAMSEEAMEQLEDIEPMFDPTRPAEERLQEWVRDCVLYIVKAPVTARVARDADPGVVHMLMNHELARTVLGMNAALDKATLFSGLVGEAFPGAFSDDEAGDIASMMRAISHMAPALLDEQVRFGLSIERMAELMSGLLLAGMRARLG